jgi:hypothetical protein
MIFLSPREGGLGDSAVICRGEALVVGVGEGTGFNAEDMLGFSSQSWEFKWLRVENGAVSSPKG